MAEGTTGGVFLLPFTPWTLPPSKKQVFSRVPFLLELESN